jgi:CRP/FNR family nitrogen fixation transcriptional regulator
MIQFSRDEIIFRQGQPVVQIYRVESGCIRTQLNLDDGRRLVTGFYFPGDYFGLETRKKHLVSSQAVTSSVLWAVRTKALNSRRAVDASVAAHMLHIMTIELQRVQNHSLLLRAPASKRVADFLFELKKRNRQKEVGLLMSRLDIADYLNLTIETVSRALTRLEKRSVISILSPRRIVVHSRKSLAA